MSPTQAHNLSSVLMDPAWCQMFVVNSAGKILRTDPNAALQLGQRKGDLRGKHVSDFLHLSGGEDLPIVVAGLQSGATSGLRKGVLVPPAGNPIEMEVVVQAVDRRDPGRYLILAKERRTDSSLAPGTDSRLRDIASAQERERQRVARELHDEALQSLLVAGMEVERLMLSDNSTKELPGGSLLHLQRLLREVENDIRQISGRMRPDTVPQCGLLDAVANAVQTLQAHGLDAELRFRGTPVPVDPNIQILAYRIVQEALHNVSRHSGAKRVRTTVTCRNNRLVIRVTDNGSGFTMPAHLDSRGPQEFLGIKGMYERASLMNARLAILPRSGMGTSICLRIPIESAA